MICERSKAGLISAITLAFGFALFAASIGYLNAQVSGYGDKEMGTPSDQTPAILYGVGVSQKLNQQLPLGLTFTDDTGKQATLESYLANRPAILALVYYRCTVLCSEELTGLTKALRMVDEVPGRDFSVIAISIDPTEGPDLAADEKSEHVKQYGHPETASGWHFMTGTQSNIDALTEAVGFRYVKIPGKNGRPAQFAHANSIQIVTPAGKLAQYYMGVEYSPRDLRLALADASSNRIGSAVDNILTYCYHYDPLTNRYSLIVARAVQAGGIVTVVLVGGFMLVMFRRDAKRSRLQEPGTKSDG